MPFWRTAVAPWIRPVHLTIIVSDGIVPDNIGRGQCAPRTALVAYSFPGVAPGEFHVRANDSTAPAVLKFAIGLAVRPVSACAVTVRTLCGMKNWTGRLRRSQL